MRRICVSIGMCVCVDEDVGVVDGHATTQCSAAAVATKTMTQ